MKVTRLARSRSPECAAASSTQLTLGHVTVLPLTCTPRLKALMAGTPRTPSPAHSALFTLSAALQSTAATSTAASPERGTRWWLDRMAPANLCTALPVPPRCPSEL